MKPNWRKFTPECHPMQTGRYLVIFCDPDHKDKGFPDVCDWFEKGDVILCKRSQLDGTPEERLLDSILNPDLQVKADMSWFYCIHDGDDDEYAWKVKPTYWAEYPEFPEGVTME